jgi:hypothetical protein
MRWFVGIIAGILLLVGLYFGTLSNRPALGMQATTQNEAELLPGAYLTEYAVESTLLPKRDNYAGYKYRPHDHQAGLQSRRPGNLYRL